MKFNVQVGRDARVYYTAEIEADSLEAAKSMVSRHGFDAPKGTVWKEDGVDDFDNVETVNIWQGEDGTITRYTDTDGWEA